jgi:hypothetical protein
MRRINFQGRLVTCALYLVHWPKLGTSTIFILDKKLYFANTKGQMQISADQFKSNATVLRQHKSYFPVPKEKRCGPFQIWHSGSIDSSKKLLTFLSSNAHEYLEQKWTDVPDGNATATSRETSNADSNYSIHGQVICHMHAAGDKLHFCYTFHHPFVPDDML